MVEKTDQFHKEIIWTDLYLQIKTLCLQALNLVIYISWSCKKMSIQVVLYEIWPYWWVNISLNFGQPILSQCALSPPPESIRNPYGFFMLSGGRQRVHWERMGQWWRTGKLLEEITQRSQLQCHCQVFLITSYLFNLI